MVSPDLDLGIDDILRELWQNEWTSVTRQTGVTMSSLAYVISLGNVLLNDADSMVLKPSCILELACFGGGKDKLDIILRYF